MATECHVWTRTPQALEGEDQQSSSFDSAWRWPLNLDTSGHASTPEDGDSVSPCDPGSHALVTMRLSASNRARVRDEAALPGAFQIRMNVGEARCRLSEDPRKAQAPPRIT